MRARSVRSASDAARRGGPAASSLLELMERTLADPGADLDRLDRVAVIYERALAREAEQAFARALIQMQRRLPRAGPTPGSPTRRTTPSPGQAASTITSKTSTGPPKPPSSAASALIRSSSAERSIAGSMPARSRRPRWWDISSKPGCCRRRSIPTVAEKRGP
jgi:hypothetical protein